MFRWTDDMIRFMADAAGRTDFHRHLAAELLPAGLFHANPLSFNLWMNLPPGWTRAAFAGQMRAAGIGIVPSDAFTASGPPPEADVAPPSYRSHPRQQLGVRERLGQIVIGPGLQPDHALGLRGPGGQDDDRDI